MLFSSRRRLKFWIVSIEAGDGKQTFRFLLCMDSTKRWWKTLGNPKRNKTDSYVNQSFFRFNEKQFQWREESKTNTLLFHFVLKAAGLPLPLIWNYMDWRQNLEEWLTMVISQQFVTSYHYSCCSVTAAILWQPHVVPWPTFNLLNFNWSCCLESFYIGELYLDWNYIDQSFYNYSSSSWTQYSILHQLVKGQMCYSNPFIHISDLRAIKQFTQKSERNVSTKWKEKLDRHITITSCLIAKCEETWQVHRKKLYTFLPHDLLIIFCLQTCWSNCLGLELVSWIPVTPCNSFTPIDAPPSVSHPDLV